MATHSVHVSVEVFEDGQPIAFKESSEAVIPADPQPGVQDMAVLVPQKVRELGAEATEAVARQYEDACTFITHVRDGRDDEDFDMGDDD